MTTEDPFTFVDSENLILEVKKYPCLYDPNIDEYKDRRLKVDSWMKVSKVLAAVVWDDMGREEKIKFGKFIQKKWKCLRDAFSRALKIQEGRSGIAAMKAKPYVYHKQMSFLIPMLHSNPCYGVVDEEVATGEDSLEQDERVEQTNRLSANERRQSLHKRKKSSEESERERLAMSVLDSLLMNETDPDRMFLLSLLPSLKRVKQQDKLDAQIKLMEVLKAYTSASTTKYNVL